MNKHDDRGGCVMIRQMHHPEEITEALDLIWETFLQFDAPDYCDEGVSAFRDFIRDEGTVATLERSSR